MGCQRHKSYFHACPDCVQEVHQQIGYAVEDGRLEVEDAQEMDFDTQVKFLRKQVDYDPY